MVIQQRSYYAGQYERLQPGDLQLELGTRGSSVTGTSKEPRVVASK